MSLPRNWPPTRADELEMLLSPREWPAWPRLPLKRYVGGKQQLGYLHAGEGLRVFDGDLVGLTGDGSSILYPNAAAVYDDGWRVD